MQDGCMLRNSVRAVTLYGFISTYSYADKVSFPHRTLDILQKIFPGGLNISTFITTLIESCIISLNSWP